MNFDWLPTYQHLLAGKRTVVLTPTVAAAQAVAEHLGPTAASVCGKTPWRERAAIYQRFRDGDLLVICGTGVAMEDIPLVAEGLVDLRPTLSHVAHTRGLYLISAGGEKAIALDLADNIRRHGIPVWFKGRTYAPTHPLLRAS